jgi:hypothetical protein
LVFWPALCAVDGGVGRVLRAGGVSEHFAQTPRRGSSPLNRGEDHCRTVRELLSFHVPPPQWTPPKRRGRPSRILQRLVARWCS